MPRTASPPLRSYHRDFMRRHPGTRRTRRHAPANPSSNRRRPCRLEEGHDVYIAPNCSFSPMQVSHLFAQLSRMEVQLMNLDSEVQLLRQRFYGSPANEVFVSLFLGVCLLLMDDVGSGGVYGDMGNWLGGWA
jgi:hypothetical protein